MRKAFYDLLCHSHFHLSLACCCRVTCMSMTDEKDAGMAFGTEDGNTEIMTLTPQFRTRKDMGRVIAKLMNEEHINQV